MYTGISGIYSKQSPCPWIRMTLFVGVGGSIHDSIYIFQFPGCIVELHLCIFNTVLNFRRKAQISYTNLYRESSKRIALSCIPQCSTFKVFLSLLLYYISLFYPVLYLSPFTVLRFSAALYIILSAPLYCIFCCISAVFVFAPLY